MLPASPLLPASTTSATLSADSWSPPVTTPADPFEAARADAAGLAERTGHERHDVAVVLGSGWTPALAAIGEADAEVGFGELGGFPRPTVAGHAGTVRSIRVGDRQALVLSGRAHLYEGHPVSTVVHAVRTAVFAGCRVIVLTNAAGVLRTDLPVGGPVLISDHLNLTGHNPLAGPAPADPLPGRFCDLSEAYSSRLRDLARSIDPTLPEGVYCGVLGPSYETPAEIRMFQTMGADLVGMSTVLEAIAARHLGAEVPGIALVTNLAAGLQAAPLAHGEVLEAGVAAAERVGTLIRQILERA
jgi:purine-nucleoside phosphorylase